MATVQERLAASLQVLKDYQEKNSMMVINSMDALGRTHTERLLNNGFLEQIIKGWYMPTFPGREGDSSVWYACFWQFVMAYCNSRFGEDWCLTPDESLAFHSGNYLVPKQLVVRSPKATNNIISLKHDTSILEIAGSIAKECIVDPIYGVRIYALSEALCFASPSFFQLDKINARTCLASISSASDILRVVASEGNSIRAGRIVGALQSIGRTETANEIQNSMSRLGYDIRPNNPFDENVIVPIADSPYATRIRLSWMEMRKQIIEEGLNSSSEIALTKSEILTAMDESYVHDAYHSLSIEGYRVTEGLIERVRSGNWHPDEDKDDAERKNALAARGYYQAFQKVRESVIKILDGADPGEVFAADHDNWHFELFEPCVQAGIISPADLFGYRTHQVYIRGSKHTPLNPDAVRPAMRTLCELMATESDGFIRAILGHFFFVFIHPYMDGNGRTARFVMNTMLCTSNMPWTIIPIEKRDAYMSALEQASTEGNILPFAHFISSLIAKK